MGWKSKTVKITKTNAPATKKVDKRQDEVISKLVKDYKNAHHIHRNSQIQGFSPPEIPITGQLLVLDPAITQGVGESGRIGEDAIATLDFKFGISPNAYDVTTNVNQVPRVVRVFIGQVIGDEFSTPNTADFANLLETSNGSTNGTGTLYDLHRPVNRQYWRIKYDKLFKVGAATGSTNNTALFANSNNDFKLFAMDKVNVFRNKKLKWNTATSNFSTNESWFMFALYARADNVVDATNQQPILISGVSTMTWS